MRSWRRLLSRSSALLTLVATGFGTAVCAEALEPASPARTKGGPVVVVASVDVTVDDLSLTELRRLFLLERRYWKPGQPAMMLYPPTASAAREVLLRRLCRTSEQELRRAILEKLYRGEIDLAPKVARSDEEAAAFVASGRGLLTLVPADIAGGLQVRVMRIDGRRPGEPGYALGD